MLPEDSILSFKEYIDMQRAIGQGTRYRLLHYLTTCGDASAKELKKALNLKRNTLHYHLNKLVDVGLVQKRTRNKPASTGLYTYYRASSFGKMILEKGVTEMIQMEDNFREIYGAAENSR
jgi:predicted ArsR family transcriptional regulator